MAVCFQLWDLGFNFNVLTEYVYTTSSKYDNAAVLELMRRNFGKCVQ